jgi:hypothetical protein
MKTLQHKVYVQPLGWIFGAPAEHPMVKVEISLCTSGCKELDLPPPRVTTKATQMLDMADTGAHITVGDLGLIHTP